MRARTIGLMTVCLAMVSFVCPSKAAADDPLSPSLRTVKRIYIDKMDNDLDQYIRAEIQKKFKNQLVVVLTPEAADAILAGVSQYQNGTKAAVTGRWLGLHDTATGSVSLLDKSGNTVLWSGEAGDRSIMWGSMRRGGPRKVADRLVSDLKKAMEQD